VEEVVEAAAAVEEVAALEAVPASVPAGIR
jgi:hypothetical protein